MINYFGKNLARWWLVVRWYDRPGAYPFVNELSAGDVSQNSTFDLSDIVGFNALFGGPASASAAAVPEPTTLSLAVVLLLGLAIRQRRRV